MSDERLEELAALHVLGALTPAEQSEFDAALGRDPELRVLVAGLLAARDAVAGAVPPVTPSPALKQRILAELDARRPKVVPLPVRPAAGNFPGIWLSWALTAAAMLLCGILYQARNDLQEQVRGQAERIEALNQMADALRSETNTLRQTVAALREPTKLADVRIALLSSLLNDSPKAVAVSLWDNQRQSGVFVVQNLKPLPADRDYQLWVLDPQNPAPVSAGVFQVDPQGNVRIQFKPDKKILTAGKFAVTLEPKGGLPAPTLKNLVLLGG